MAAELYLVLSNRDGFAAGDAQLLGDQVDAGNHFGDRVLHLDPGVHLHEIELAVAVDQKFDGARSLVVDGACRCHGGLTHLAAQICIDGNARCLLQQLLVAPLD